MTKYGASLPAAMNLVDELDGTFTINPAAPKYNGPHTRFYVVDPNEAPFYLDTYGDEAAVDDLVKLGLYDKGNKPRI